MAELHLTGTSAGTILQANNSITSNQTFTFPDAGGELVVTPGTAEISVDKASGYFFRGYESGTERFQIASDGQVVLRNDAGDALYVLRNTGGISAVKGSFSVDASDGIKFTSSSGATSQINGDGIYQSKTDGTGSCNMLASGAITAAGAKFSVDSNGEVTVGDPQSLRLSYNAANARVLSVGGKDLYCRTEGQQGCVQSGSGWVPAASERKLKTNITAVNADDCWDSIKGIQLHNFYYRTQENKTGVPYLGPIVDELETTNPDLVIDAKASKTFNQPLLEMKAIQALQTALTRIEALEAEIQTLKGGAQ